MSKKLLDSKFLYVVLSIIISVSLWYYVTTVEGVTDTDTVHNIPVVFEGEDILMENGLMITSENPSVNMKFEGTAATLVKLKQDGAITLSVDVSAITMPGTYTVAYETAYSGVSKNSFSVVDQSPVNVTITVERYVTSQIEIKGEFTGQLAEGYMFQLDNNNQPKFTFSPQTLTVSGKKSDVDRIAYALVTIGNMELSETIRGEFTYELFGWDGEPLDPGTLDIECSHDTISTTLRVLMYADIPLSVEFVDGGGASLEENVIWEMSVDSIIVAGEAADMESLLARGKLSVGTINLAEIAENETTIVRTIPLAEELTNVDGVTEVVITISISGLVSETLEVTEFDIQNIPEGYKATVQTKSLNVVVRGTEEELELVSAANLRVVADLTDINLAGGQYTVNAKIYFDGIGNAGVVGTSYPLAIRLTEQ